MLTILALLTALAGPQDFNPGKDSERTIGNSYRTEASQWNPHPDPSLAASGDAAIRFSTMPALRWGEGNIVTIVPDARGNAIATVKTVRRNCGVKPCRPVSRRGPSFAFCIKGDCSYRGFAGQVRALLFDPARMPARNGALEICTDGPGYLTELREHGQTYNLSGFCAQNHPNNSVYRLVREGVGRRWPIGLGD
jgi:hypothetical protein